jgi:hypothetical protein
LVKILLMLYCFKIWKNFYVYRTVNRHRWFSSVYFGDRENSIEGTRQINYVTSEKVGPINIA